MKNVSVFNILLALFFAFAMIWAPLAAEAPEAFETRGEEYFLIRYLELLYTQWPQDSSDPTEFSTAAAELRRQAIRFQVRAQRADLHPSVIDGYAAFVKQLDTYTHFLSNIGAIEQAAMDRAGKEEFASGYASGFVGTSTFFSSIGT